MNADHEQAKLQADLDIKHAGSEYDNLARAYLELRGLASAVIDCWDTQMYEDSAEDISVYIDALREVL